MELDPQFTVAIEQLARMHTHCKWRVTTHGYDRYPYLREHFQKHGEIIVASDYSSKTVYGSAPINHAFRAWHDYIHVKHDLPFTPEGEFRVFTIQGEQLMNYLDYSQQAFKFYEYLYIEIVGQFLYKERHKEFPNDQLQFALNWLTRGRDFAIRTKT